MIVLDACAVIALLKNEPAAASVEQLLKSGDTACLTVLGVAEVLDHLVRLAGATEEEARLDLATLGVEPPAMLTEEVATAAGLLRARHYHRRNCAISLADCVVLETARRAARAVATSDPHLLDVCLNEGVDGHPLADTNGRVWSPPTTTHT